MKNNLYIVTAAFMAVVLLISANRRDKHPYGLENGTPDMQSINGLAFGPEGVLFIGDSKNASIVAIDTKDKGMVAKARAVEMKNIDQRIAALLGTEAKNISILDLAVNPLSKKIYCAVQGLDGAPVLLTIEG